MRKDPAHAKLTKLADLIGDLVAAIIVERKKVELHEAAAHKHRADVDAFRLEHGPDAELSAPTRFGLDIAERAAIAARADLAGLEKSLAEARAAHGAQFCRPNPQSCSCFT